MDEFSALIDAMERFLRQQKHPMVDQFLADWPSKPWNMRENTPTRLPVLPFLDEAIGGTPEAKALIERLQGLRPSLMWGQTYSAEDFGPAFLERYGWTECMGMRGPIPHTTLGSGFLLLGPDLEYPNHSHEAEEIYVPLTSGAMWFHEDEGWIERPGGVPIYHRPWVKHAMRTKEAPLLILYLWRGSNLTQKSRIDLK